MPHAPDRSFFARAPLVVARGLLGCVVSARGVTVRLTEVEAYAGPAGPAGTADPASHAYRGPTPRSSVMFGPPGRLYVYLVYGMHWCANVVCGADGEAAAVLLRAGEVTTGAGLARERRPAARSLHDLARGPAKLAGVLALTGADTGLDLCAPAAEITVLAGSPPATDVVRSGPRVGVSAAGDRPWRFWLAGEPTVSRYRPAGRRTAGPVVGG
ncbi:MAG: DNA-3-methyladenine glycosylase [Actinobacteria bacterium]|nr:DNA-3-methyladenine glycosylase [Actinomycetota bacterium]MBI3687674.1 DNA-3-methyladenine glycosylase [Actinomycetota bacterium]